MKGARQTRAGGASNAHDTVGCCRDREVSPSVTHRSEPNCSGDEALIGEPAQNETGGAVGAEAQAQRPALAGSHPGQGRSEEPRRVAGSRAARITQISQPTSNQQPDARRATARGRERLEDGVTAARQRRVSRCVHTLPQPVSHRCDETLFRTEVSGDERVAAIDIARHLPKGGAVCTGAREAVPGSLEDGGLGRCALKIPHSAWHHRETICRHLDTKRPRSRTLSMPVPRLCCACRHTRPSATRSPGRAGVTPDQRRRPGPGSGTERVLRSVHLNRPVDDLSVSSVGKPKVRPVVDWRIVGSACSSTSTVLTGATLTLRRGRARNRGR